MAAIKNGIDMNSIYIIVYGLRTCSDNDEILGYVETESMAKDMVGELNEELPPESSYAYTYEIVGKLI